MSRLSRRGVLRLLGGSGAGISAGCASVPFFGDETSEYDPGTLVVKNQHSLAHVVSVSVTDPESVVTENVRRDVIMVLDTGLEGQIPVDAGETKRYPDFLSGAVMYTVKMWLGATGAEIPPDADEHDNVVEAKFSPAASATSDAPHCSGDAERTTVMACDIYPLSELNACLGGMFRSHCCVLLL